MEQQVGMYFENKKLISRICYDFNILINEQPYSDYMSIIKNDSIDIQLSILSFYLDQSIELPTKINYSDCLYKQNDTIKIEINANGVIHTIQFDINHQIQTITVPSTNFIHIHCDNRYVMPMTLKFNIIPTIEESQNTKRIERNQFLTNSDWTQLPDTNLTTEQQNKYKIYRQQLRDIDFTDPNNIVYPTIV